jgi:hypothetical protein
MYLFGDVLTEVLPAQFSSSQTIAKTTASCSRKLRNNAGNIKFIGIMMMRCRARSLCLTIMG